MNADQIIFVGRVISGRCDFADADFLNTMISYYGFTHIFRHIQARTKARLIQCDGELDIVTKVSTDINGVQIFINEGQRELVLTNSHTARLQNGCCLIA